MSLSPGSIPRLKDHCPVLLGIFLVLRCLPRTSTDVQDLFVVPSSASYYLYQPVPRVCINTLSKDNYCAVFLSREQFYLCLVGDKIESLFKSYSVCVCVCEAHEPSRATLVQFSKDSRASGTFFFRYVYFMRLSKGKCKFYVSSLFHCM